MMDRNTLEGFVNRGWHGLSYGQWGSVDIRRPHTEQYDTPPVTSFFGYDVLSKLPHTKSDSFIYTNLPSVNHMDIAEYSIVRDGIGLTKSFEVVKQAREPDTLEEVVIPRKFLGFIPYGKIEQRTKLGNTKYLPVYVDSNNNVTTEKEGNERLLGMLFEFFDRRWDHRGETTQYTIVLRESDYKLLRQLIAEDPSLMMQLYSKAFPLARFAKSDIPFPEVNHFLFAETADELKRLKELR